jgi:hypothetical protein
LYNLDLVNPEKIVDYKRKLVLCRALAVVSLLIFTAVITTTTTIQSANAQNESDKSGNVVNSKYLSITDQRYRSGQFSDTITGTIMNNST